MKIIFVIIIAIVCCIVGLFIGCLINTDEPDPDDIGRSSNW